MRIEPKAAFYNEETGAVQPWKDIEVTDSVGNALVSEGLAIAIAEGGGGGGGESVTWILDNATATVAFDEGYEAYAAIYNLPETITADNLISTFSGKNCVTILDGVKIEAPAVIAEDSQIVKCYYWNALYDSINDLQLSQYELRVIVTSYAASDEGKTATLSFGIVDE